MADSTASTEQIKANVTLNNITIYANFQYSKNIFIVKILLTCELFSTNFIYI